MKQLLKCILPHGIVRLLQTRQERGYQRSRAMLQQHKLVKSAPYKELLVFLASRGLDATQIREGSIPEDSLAFLATFLNDLPSKNDAIRGIHVGNFLGVSLAYLTASLKSIHPESVIVAVDPNLEHRAIPHPQDHVCALLDQFGLSGNVLLCCGFSHEKNVGNDGRNYLEDYRLLRAEEIAASIAVQHAPHSVIRQLLKLNAGPFDFALIDGNHESAYVEEELRNIHPLMKKSGLIFMDDVSEGWPMLKQVFEKSAGSQYQIRESDGRVGVLQVL